MRLTKFLALLIVPPVPVAYIVSGSICQRWWFEEQNCLHASDQFGEVFGSLLLIFSVIWLLFLLAVLLVNLSVGMMSKRLK